MDRPPIASMSQGGLDLSLPLSAEQTGGVMSVIQIQVAPGWLALALRRLGLEVTVFEQAKDVQRIGGGIVLHDNGQRVLQALGLLEGFRPHLQPCPVIAAERCRGKALGAVDFGRFSPPL